MSERWTTFGKNNFTRWCEILAIVWKEKRKRTELLSKYSQVRVQCLRLTELNAKTKPVEKKENGCNELNNSRD